jgi:hypothetical protein
MNGKPAPTSEARSGAAAQFPRSSRRSASSPGGTAAHAQAKLAEGKKQIDDRRDGRRR